MRLMERYGYNIPTLDVLTGPVMGRPRSASFKTADMVGLDIFHHVAKNVRDNVPDSEEQALYMLPSFVDDLIEAGVLGDKVKHGFCQKASVKDTRVLGPPQRAQRNSPAKPQVFQGTFKLWREANSP